MGGQYPRQSVGEARSLRKADKGNRGFTVRLLGRASSKESRTDFGEGAQRCGNCEGVGGGTFVRLVPVGLDIGIELGRNCGAI